MKSASFQRRVTIIPDKIDEIAPSLVEPRQKKAAKRDGVIDDP